MIKNLLWKILINFYENICAGVQITGVHSRGELQHAGDVSKEKNQVSTNQNSRNRWCQIVGGIICWLIRIGWRPSTIFIKMETLKQMFPWECWETPTSWNNSELLQKIDKKLARHIHCNHMLFWKFQINKSVLLIEIMKF